MLLVHFNQFEHHRHCTHNITHCSVSFCGWSKLHNILRRNGTPSNIIAASQGKSARKMSSLSNSERLTGQHCNHPCCRSGRSSVALRMYSDVRSTSDPQPAQHHRTLHTAECSGHPSFLRSMLLIATTRSLVNRCAMAVIQTLTCFKSWQKPTATAI